MSGAFGTMGMEGQLEAKLIRASKKNPRKAFHIKVPGLGRLFFTRDQGESMLFGGNYLVSRLGAVHRDAKGRVIKEYDFGSGSTTYWLSLGLANEWVSAANSSCLKNLTYMASGTSSTAVNNWDYQLNTEVSPVTSTITPTVAAVASSTGIATLQWVGTCSYTSTNSIQEWGLFAGGGTVGSQYNTSTDTFTGTTATPGTSPSWSVNTWAGQYIVLVGGTPVVGFITSNSATALTVSPGWVNGTSAGGIGTTPSSNTAMNIYPLMSDHKEFSAINVVNGDSIQFTYTLTINAGG